MPTYYMEDYASRVRHRKACEAAVRAKFPGIIEGGSGWHRALSARMRKARP